MIYLTLYRQTINNLLLTIRDTKDFFKQELLSFQVLI